MSIHSKRDFVFKNKLCFNCLGTKHSVNQCTREKCRVCSGKHHSLLHEDRETKSSSSKGNGNEAAVKDTQKQDLTTKVTSQSHSATQTSTNCSTQCHTYVSTGYVPQQN